MHCHCVPSVHRAAARLALLPQGARSWDAELLPLIERLLAAGYRPAVFENVLVRRGAWNCPTQLYKRFDPAVEDEGLDLQGVNRQGRGAAAGCYFWSEKCISARPCRCLKHNMQEPVALPALASTPPLPSFSSDARTQVAVAGGAAP